MTSPLKLYIKLYILLLVLSVLINKDNADGNGALKAGVSEKTNKTNQNVAPCSTCLFHRFIRFMILAFQVRSVPTYWLISLSSV